MFCAGGLALTAVHPVKIGWSARVDTPVGFYRLEIYEYDINAEAHPDLVLYQRLGGVADLMLFALGMTSGAELGIADDD